MNKDNWLVKRLKLPILAFLSTSLVLWKVQARMFPPVPRDKLGNICKIYNNWLSSFTNMASNRKSLLWTANYKKSSPTRTTLAIATKTKLRISPPCQQSWAPAVRCRSFSLEITVGTVIMLIGCWTSILWRRITVRCSAITHCSTDKNIIITSLETH